MRNAATEHAKAEELHVEAFYPADAETEATLQAYEERVKEMFA